MIAKSHTRELLYIISYNMEFKKTKNEIISKHFDINTITTYVKFMNKDGRYFYYKFNQNHKIQEKIIWQI